MTDYTKVIGLLDQYYTREHVKIKHHKNKVREISESTVAKAFLEGNARIRVYFMETDKELFLDFASDPEDIKKYLGKKFMK